MIERLDAASRRRQPWKNGLGVSSVIAEDPPGAGFDGLRWQVSTTEIASDCPFSGLPGLDRLFLVLEGEGVELDSRDEAGQERRSRVLRGAGPCAFRGDWTTHCRLLGGPVRVLNVITRRGAVEAALEAGLRQAGAAPGETLVVLEAGTLEAWRLGAGDAWTARAAPLFVARLR